MSEAKEKALSTSELTLIRETLLARRQEVVASQTTQLNELNAPEGKNHLADLEDISESAGVDSACEILDIHGATVSQIDVALEKIDAGNYGNCESCENPIPRARLEALPFAGLCVNCQRAKELQPDEEVF